MTETFVSYGITRKIKRKGDREPRDKSLKFESPILDSESSVVSRKRSELLRDFIYLVSLHTFE